MFDYEAKGSIRIVGCAGFSMEKKYLAKFLEGYRAYVRKKAKFGKIESVIIKRLRRMMPESTSRYGIQPDVMYTDTLNRVWSEDELIFQEEAVDLARLYWENVEQEGRALLEEGGVCFPISDECG